MTGSSSFEPGPVPALVAAPPMLTKVAAYRTLKVGDPYTFILSEPIWKSDREMVGVGDLISRWFATNEPGRIFQIVAVHGATYETKLFGFEEFAEADADPGGGAP